MGVVAKKFKQSDLDALNSSAYEILNEVSERTSHLLRTPLNVALGVLNDAANGIALSQSDFQDGVAAIRKIVRRLDLLSEFNLVKHVACRAEPLSDFLNTLPKTFHHESSEVSFKVDIAHRDLIYLVDTTLLRKAHCLILSYALAEALEGRSLSRYEFLLEVKTIDSGKTSASLQLRYKFPVEVKQGSNYSLGAFKASELISIDRRLEALSLLVVERIAELHGGCCWLELQEAMFEIVLEVC